ncbi:MAG: glutamyl-tRNA synthetase [Deltaproteobacteria bacterium ADurb.Bin510]|nr:MAG: glutamyl-tRNA synthetase [Deltaproteobacteria bacterium ADurb.Bin510]
MEEVFKQVLENHQIKFKLIAQPVRVALTGKTVSPGIFEIIATLDKVVLPRLKAALAHMEARA